MEKKMKLVPIPTKKSLHRFSKTKAIAALFILAFGFSLIPTAIILDNTIQTKIDEAIAEQITVPDSKDDDSYEEWKSSKESDIPFYTKYYMWNLTNPAEYLAGGKPVYEEIGPYVFREYTSKYNVRYSSNKEEVSYNSYTTYEFDQGKSGKHMLNESITNINPGYLGVLNMTKTESRLIEMMSPTVFSTIKTTFENEFKDQLNDAWGSIYSEIFSTIKNKIPFGVVAYDCDIAETANVILNRIKKYLTQPGFAERVFFEEWANDNFPDIPDSIFNGITLKVWIIGIIPSWENLDDELKGTGDKIEKRAHKMIGDIDIDGRQPYNCPGTPNDLSIRKGALSILEKAGSAYNNNPIALIYVEFGIVIFPYINIQSSFPGIQSYRDAYVAAQNLNIFEILTSLIWNSKDIYSLIGNDSSYWWRAADGNEDAKEFLKNHFSFKFIIPGIINIIFKLTDQQLDKILSWLRLTRDGIAITIPLFPSITIRIKGWLDNVCNYEVKNMNSGLLTTRTVEEWLFEAEDNLIKNVDPDLADVNLFDNLQNETEAIKEGTDRYTIKTGKHNADEAKETVEYNSEEEISIWEPGIEVEGTDGTQFSPGLTVDDDTLKVFVSDLVRPVDFEFSKLTEIYDIKLYHYKFSEELFEPAPEFYMDTQGLAYMYPKYGIPVYLSKPHFLGADPSVSGAVLGMSPDSAKHDTYIDVEPITGITMNARARLQVNFKVTPTDKWYAEVQEAYMPILWVEKEAEISEEKAEEFKESLYEALELRRTIIPAITGLGAFMMVIGFMFSYTEAVKRRKAKVQRIKEKYGGNKLIKHPPISK